MSKTWLITGSGRGLGRAIAEAVLAKGDRLLATARDPRQLQDLQARYGDRLYVTALDVTDALAAADAVNAAVDAFGRLDVLVNNAGYGHAAPFEQTDPEDFRAQIETNFLGVVNLCRAAVPVMRRQRSGHILQVSSVGGRLGSPGLSAYQAAKWAVGGFSEVLAQELAPLGIQVCALEPGGMRTEWAAEAMNAMPVLLPEYEPSLGLFSRMLSQYRGHEVGDPARIAQLILRLAEHPRLPVHLLLGSDAVHVAGRAEGERADAARRWQAVSLSTDFDADVAPVLPDADAEPAAGLRFEDLPLAVRGDGSAEAPRS